MRLLPLVAATYFMVAGGPYGLEDILGMAGYLPALLMLLVVPFIWSLPTALMVGELASALPQEGGYYVWVRRALGPFWGFQEAWLSLAASVFDMAIYPTIFVAYLARLAPQLTSGHRALLWSVAVVLSCALWNLRGARIVGLGSVGLFCVLIAPFVVLVVLGLLRWHGHGSGALLVHAGGGASSVAPDLAGALSVTLWNYMGWDNASTVAQEVHDPQRNYPRAMLASAALVAATYILPLAAVALAGISAHQFLLHADSGTGSWTDAARLLGGPLLALAVVLGGMINGVGMFNALTLSYTRVPFALAEDAVEASPRQPHRLARLFTRRNRFSVPWASVVACSVLWALALNFTFERLISIDLVLYGAALLLEFVALIVLRRREPALHRPFRIPGGIAGTVTATLGPALLIAFALYAARHEQVLGINALGFALLVAVAGAGVYALAQGLRRGGRASA